MCTKQFLLIYLMNFLSIFLGIFLIGSEKEFGKDHFTNEKFLSLVASCGGIFSALRFIWSFLLDKFKYKVIYGILLAMQVFIGAALPYFLDQEISTSTKEAIFFAMIMAAFFCEGGHFVLAPTICGKLFGAEGGIRVFSVCYSFCGCASLINIVLIDLLFDEWLDIGFEGFCHVYSMLSLLSLFILIFIFREEKAFLK